MSDLHNKRAHRVAQLLKNELSALTVRGLRDPRVGLVTITDVRLTDDLRTAQVFVSVLGDDEARKASLAGLAAAAGYLRHAVTHSLQLRFAPVLYFRYDDTLARAQRLDDLFGAAARGEAKPSETEAPAMPPAQTGRELRTLAGPLAPPSAPAPKKRPKSRARKARPARAKARG